MAKIISIASQKGGVGKTTTAVNISACLSAKDKKVLLIDSDPQGSSSSGVGVDKRNVTTSLYEVFNGESIEKAIIKTEFKNLSIISSNIDLAAAEIQIATMENREFILKNALAKIRGDYDYIIIDCPPSLGMITTNAMCVSDTVLIPVECEYYALEGLAQLMNTIRIVKRTLNSNLDIESLLFTKYDGRLNLTQQVVQEVKRCFPKKVYATVIPRSVRLAEAPSFGKPIIYYEKSNKCAEAYNKIADAIIKNT